MIDIKCLIMASAVFSEPTGGCMELTLVAYLVKFHLGLL